MKRRNHSFIDTNICGCGVTFRYYRVKKPKIYCRPCRARERREHIRFHNATYYHLNKVVA
jgi:hypothetical protein